MSYCKDAKYLITVLQKLRKGREGEKTKRSVLLF